MCKVLRDLSEASKGVTQLPLEMRRCMRLLEVRAWLVYVSPRACCVLSPNVLSSKLHQTVVKLSPHPFKPTDQPTNQPTNQPDRNPTTRWSAKRWS